MPELLKIIPIEQFRGYSKIKEVDQSKVKDLLSLPVDSNWKDLMKAKAEKSKKEKAQKLEAKEEENKK